VWAPLPEQLSDLPQPNSCRSNNESIIAYLATSSHRQQPAIRMQDAAGNLKLTLEH
jgi:hypothetical protein